MGNYLGFKIKYVFNEDKPQSVFILAMVDDFEKKYKALEIPYPKDTAQAEIATEEAKQKAAYEKFVTESKTRAEGLGAELAKVTLTSQKIFAKFYKINPLFEP